MSAFPDALPPAPLDEYDNQPPLTEVQRVTDVFFAPTKTFADVRRNRSWWLPFVVMLVFGYIFSTTVMHKVNPRNMAMAALQNNSAQYERLQNASEEDRERTLGFTEGVMRISLWGWPVFTLAATAVSALLLWVGFNFILGGSSTYKGMFTVSIFAFLPTILRSILATILLLAGQTENFNISDPIGTNPGFYLGPDASHFMKSLLSSLDLFSIWTLLLMAVGGAIVARVKVQKGVFMVCVVWLVCVLGKAAVAAL